MKTIDDLDDLATVSNHTINELHTPNVRVLALFVAASRHFTVAWQAKGTTVALKLLPGDNYEVTVDGVQSAVGTIGVLFDTVTRLSEALERKPTPTARAYIEFGFWADVQDGCLVHYPMSSDGSWDKEPCGFEYTCPHMLARVNAHFGTNFTTDDFIGGYEEGDCECDD
jgi:hypothetical protein